MTASPTAQITRLQGKVEQCRIEANQCGWRAILRLIVKMDDQAHRIGLNPPMTDGSQETAKRPIIAVVDDDPAVCSSLKFALELEGFAVCIYHSGAELLLAYDIEDFNCFVVDQRMPGMTGMELAVVLRARRVLTPVILIISHPNAALSARAEGRHPHCRKAALGQCAGGTHSRGLFGLIARSPRSLMKIDVAAVRA
jgi:two-component system response regulator FixJ